MTKVYDTATDLITFARLQSQNTTSGSSYLGSDGLLKFAAEDEPRIEYAADGSLKGLLIEEQRTNLVTHSDLSSGWTEVRSSIDPNVTNEVSPDGTNNVTAIKSDLTASNSHRASLTVANPLSSTGAFTLSAFVKDNGTNVQFEVTVDVLNTTQKREVLVLFDLQAGTAATPYTTGSPNVIGYDIENVGGGWYRCHVTTDNPDGKRVDVALALSQFSVSIPNAAFNGDGTSGVFVYGAQFELGSFPTSYIPTSGSQSTRSPDIASIPVSAFGYNQDAGTVVVSFDTFQDPGDPGSRFVASVGTDGRFCYVNGDYAKALDGTNVATGGQLYNPGAFTTATAFGASGISMALDGGSPGTGSFDGSWGSGNDLMLGHLSSASQLNGHIKSLSYFPRRLTNAQLQELTS